MKNKKWVSTLIIVAILLIASIGTYMCYPMVQKTIKNKALDTHKISYYMSDYLENCVYAVDLELKAKNKDNDSPSQYIKIEGEHNQQVQSNLQSFVYDIENTKRELSNQTDILYQAIDNTSGAVASNTDQNLMNIANDENLSKDYLWFIQIQYDQEGNYFVNFMSDDSHEFPTSWYDYNQTFDYDNDDETTTTMTYSSPQNITVTFAVVKSLSPHGNLTVYLESTSTHFYIKYALPYLLLAVAFIIVASFCIPLRYYEDNKLFQMIAKIKFEILAIMWCTIYSMMCLSIPYLISLTSQNQLMIIYQEFAIEKFAPYITSFVNVTFWFIYYFLTMVLIYMIKYLYHKGIKRYFKENTCLGWLMIYLKKVIEDIMSIDFQDSTQSIVFKAVLFNFVVMSIISLFFAFGPFLALIYSIVIYLLLTKKLHKTKQDYQILLNATKQLSAGHFDVQINENVGVFNPLKEEFSHIKDGFQKAVKEEVKSQKMKTELISNVSHDLKTPLTSLITYIDLLKNVDNQEDRQHYIEILDRNALRLKNLIDDLFEVSKASSGDVKLDLVDVDIVSLIKQAQLECQDKLDEKHLDMRMKNMDEKVICHLDSSKTYRIFENLFMNMSKYALPHTRAYIELIDEKDVVHIVFKNISEEEMTFNENEVVERFVQGDKSRNTSGSGLGLAIVKSFTELQGGQLKIELDGDLFKSIITFKKAG